MEAGASQSERVAVAAREFAARRVQFERARDSRAICVLGFQMMYEEVARLLDGNAGGFDDPAWVADLAVRFADCAFEAFTGIDAACAASPGAPDLVGVCKPWADAYRALSRPDTAVVEDLLCGLIAHIGHDLPLTLARVGLESHGTSRIADFHRLNDVLASLVDPVQDAIRDRYGRYIGWLDRLGGRADEIATDAAMEMTRAVAWYNAARLLDPTSARTAQAEIEGVTERLLAGLHRPRRLSYRVVLWSARAVGRVRRQWPPVEMATVEVVEVR